ncbi:MAG: RNA polymerase sigma-70 factor [Chitinophagaceae bacterium]|nr:RNA polymerase sigma-70 factor [Chitinophagaceae bacterium]
MNPDLNSNNIIELFHRKDEGATRYIYNSFYRSLCYYAQGILHNNQEAEDIVVDAFVKLLHKRKDFYQIKDIKAFLYTATRNACIDFLRKQKRHEYLHNEIEYLTAHAMVADDMDIVNAEVLATLYREIENLPTQCSAVFKLLFFQRLTTGQAATQLNISAKTVLNQKGKAIQLLRKAFLQKGMLPLLAIAIGVAEI